MMKYSKSYAVTGMCNSETQHWRGELRGYAVTRTRMCESFSMGKEIFVIGKWRVTA